MKFIKNIIFFFLVFFNCAFVFSQGKTFTVTNTNASGVGSLKAAIDSVNARVTTASSKHKIIVSPGLPSPYTITLTALLPSINQPVEVDGKINTNTNLIINGNGVSMGLRLSSTYSVVKNISFRKFNLNSGRAIQVDYDYNSIESCAFDSCYCGAFIDGSNNLVKYSSFRWIGAVGVSLRKENNIIFPANRFYNTNKTGVGINLLTSAINNRIGGEITAPEMMNIFEGLSTGISNFGSGTKIYGNLIGGPSKLSSSDCTGPDYGSPNTNGILIQTTGRAEVGKAGQSDDRFANIILGNATSEIVIVNAGRNKIAGNYLGIDKYSCTPSSVISAGIYGVDIQGASDSNIVGSPVNSIYNEFDGNVIVKHTHGIAVRGGNGNYINGNFIGTDRNGAAGLGNKYGVNSMSMSYGTIIDGNVISGNTDNGIASQTKNYISNNKIGTTKDGLDTLGNKGMGINVLNGSKGSIIKNNLISGNKNYGILVQSDSLVITGNKIGTNIDGGMLITTGVQTYGIRLYIGTGSTVGGSSGFEANVVSGNKTGMLISGKKHNVIGNYIGTTANGRDTLGNTSMGIYILGGSNGTLIKNNLVSGNKDYGVLILSDSILLTGNKIGTNIDGEVLVVKGVQSYGLRINSGNGCLVGGTTPSEGNIISANQTGVWVAGRGQRLIGNYIGTTPAGSSSVGNTQYGISLISARQCKIGGNRLNGEGNVSGGNGYNGIYLTNSDSCMIKGNYVGTDLMGKLLPNGSSGIFLNGGCEYNVIGSTLPGEGNTVANSESFGVVVYTTTPPSYATTSPSKNNKISGNSIYNNAYKAISLYYGQATQGNEGKPVPVIDSVKYMAPDKVLVRGTAQPGDSIEVYSSDATGKDAYIYTGTGVADGTGKFNFTATVSSQDRYYVATATGNPSKNTSELSAKKAGICAYVGIDTRQVYPASYDVYQNTSLLNNNLVSGSSGTGLGRMNLNPVIPANTSSISIRIKESNYNDSLDISFGIDKNLNITSPKATIASYNSEALSPEHYLVDTTNVGCDAIAFYTEPREELPLNISSNLKDGVVAGDTLELAGLSGLQAELTVYRLGETVPVSTMNNGSSADKITWAFIPGGRYTFMLKLTDTSLPAARTVYYRGQFVKK